MRRQVTVVCFYTEHANSELLTRGEYNENKDTPPSPVFINQGDQGKNMVNFFIMGFLNKYFGG